MKTVEVDSEDGTALTVVVECPMFWEDEGP
jgi:hypothetical protein